MHCAAERPGQRRGVFVTGTRGQRHIRAVRQRQRIASFGIAGHDKDTPDLIGGDDRCARQHFPRLPTNRAPYHSLSPTLRQGGVPTPARLQPVEQYVTRQRQTSTCGVSASHTRTNRGSRNTTEYRRECGRRRDRLNMLPLNTGTSASASRLSAKSRHITFRKPLSNTPAFAPVRRLPCRQPIC